MNFVADPKVGSCQPATFFAACSLEMKSQQCISVAATGGDSLAGEMVRIRLANKD